MIAQSFFRHFPSPQFLNPPRVGISFSDQSLKMVRLGHSGSTFPIDTLFVPLEPGIVVGGSISKPDQFVKIISEASKKFNVKYASFTIPDEFTYFYKVFLPTTKGGDLTESIAFTIEENVPLGLADTLFDFVPVSINEKNNTHEVETVVVACAKKEIDKISEILLSSGLEPLSCLPESQAITEAIIPKDTSGSVCVVHVRENRITIYLVRNRLVEFVTIRNINKEDYEQTFLDEYSKFIEYLEKYQNGLDKNIGQVFICGEFEYVKQIASVMKMSLASNNKTALANVWTNIFDISKYTPELSYEISLSFGGAIGVVATNV